MNAKRLRAWAIGTIAVIMLTALAIGAGGNAVSSRVDDELDEARRRLDAAQEALAVERADDAAEIERLTELLKMHGGEKNGLIRQIERLDARIAAQQLAIIDLHGRLVRPDRVRIWTWARVPDDSMLAQRANVVQTVRIDCEHWSNRPRPGTHWPKTPEEFAADAIAEIEARGLAPDEIAIIPQNFAGDKWGSRLFYHPDDAAAIADGLNTPYTAAGLAEFRAWFDAAAAAWRGPTPTRIFFDAEPPVGRNGALDAWRGNSALRAFDWMRHNDPRFEHVPIIGTDRTLAEHYAAAGAPAYDPTQGTYHANNRAWREWYARLTKDAFEATIEALGAHIRTHWPRCISTNYGDHESPPFYGGAERFEAAHLDLDELIAPWVQIPTITTDPSGEKLTNVYETLSILAELDARELIVWWNHREPIIHKRAGNFDAFDAAMRSAYSAVPPELPLRGD